MEEAVTFQNRNGERLFGIVHIPENRGEKDPRIGINLLNPGIKYRVAPNRLNVKLARRLCRLGYYVLRFDPAGIGDSEGELPDGVLVPDIWEQIQKGLFVSDTKIANDFFRSRCRLRNLLLMGNCGGAITALLTSREDSRIDGLCLVDVPVNLRTASMTFADKVDSGGDHAQWLFSEYVKRVLSLESWKRFVKRETDFRALAKVLRMKAEQVLGISARSKHLPQDIEKLCNAGHLNRLFFEGFESLRVKRRPLFFILAGNDPGTEIFERYFRKGYLGQRGLLASEDKLIQMFVVENASHVYSLGESQESLFTAVENWLSGLNLVTEPRH
jgi:pimeloyl-ACP methyl ester carboxylesterase